ncbi:MAG TPA: alpha/beta fold hydrolase [Rugosimonospora sp.]|nr:alpha/beta fold hydrolase [Rugosimonospora sp.]
MTLVELPDGRVLEVVTAGPEDGIPFVVHHGTPGAARPYPPMVEAAARRGLRTICYSRPGYGASTAQPGRTVASAAADTAAVLDALGAGEFLTMGGSGGGPHALCCAALLPDRCRGAASIAGVAPYGAAGLDWLAGMGAENIEEFDATLGGPDTLTAYLAAQLPQLAEVTGAELVPALGDLLSPVDSAVLTGEYADFMAGSFRHATSTGTAGWRDDDLAFVRDWGFPLEAVRRATVWQGGQDRMVPYAHGEWLAKHVPGARARLLQAEGHLSLLLAKVDEVLDDLLSYPAIP